MNNLAPIVLFTYKRHEKLKHTINALAKNFFAEQSDLIIYSDGARIIKDQIIINEIRSYLKTITGFKTVTIHESNTNQGLAFSIINGVSAVMAIHHKAIVLEDDLITSTNFLAYMNAGLNEYKDQKKVYSISGYSFDFKNESIQEDAYFLNRSWSWGWASWEDRWTEVDWEVKNYNVFLKDLSQKKEFSKFGSDVCGMLKKQMEGLGDSWYIRFIYHQFKVKGLSLYPSISKIDNNGFDTMATNTSGLKSRYKTQLDSLSKTNFIFPNEIEINKDIQKALIKKLNYRSRLINKFKELFLNDTISKEIKNIFFSKNNLEEI
jgi:hypothetical protein